MSSEYKIPEGYRAIPKADPRYVVSSNGSVYNLKTQKMLKQHWNTFSVYTIIKDPYGNQIRFNHLKLDDPKYTPLTKEWVLEEDGAKVIPDHPDYAVSHYGAVYRIVPRGTGPRAGEVFMLREHTKNGFPYVSIRVEGRKKPREVRVDKLTKLLWGDDSTYQC